ncbi:unnamed protein product, partial [Chrysoparadoxa australica]
RREVLLGQRPVSPAVGGVVRKKGTRTQPSTNERRLGDGDGRDGGNDLISRFALPRYSLPAQDVERATVISIKAKEKTVARKASDRPQSNYIHVVAVAYKGGLTNFYDSQGELLTSIQYAAAPTQLFSFDGADDPLMAAVLQDGTLVIHSMALRIKGRWVAGSNTKRRSQQHTSKDDAADSTSGMALHLDEMAVVPPSSSRITSLLVFYHRGRRRSVVFAGDDSGGIGLLMSNGTQLHSESSWQAGEVTAVARVGQTLAIGDGAQVRFFNTLKFEETPARTCRCGGAGAPNVTSVVFDTLLPGYLYAGMSSGEVLVFNTKAGEGGERLCKLAHKLQAAEGPEVQPITGLDAVRGYLLSSSESFLIGYNTTGISRARPREVARATQGESPVSLTRGTYSRHSDLLLAQLRSGSVEVHELYLPYESQDLDLSWIRQPILFLIVIGVIAFQACKAQGRKQRSPPPPMPMRGTMGTMEVDQGLDADIL